MLRAVVAGVGLSGRAAVVKKEEEDAVLNQGTSETKGGRGEEWRGFDSWLLGCDLGEEGAVEVQLRAAAVGGEEGGSAGVCGHVGCGRAPAECRDPLRCAEHVAAKAPSSEQASTAWHGHAPLGGGLLRHC